MYESSDNNTLTDNTACGNHGDGILVEKCTSNILTGNTACNNRYGIHLVPDRGRWWPPPVPDAHILTRNTASFNTLYGIYVEYFCAGNTLSGNSANSNGDGIYMVANENTLTNNTASRNQRYGMRLSGGSNVVTGNTFSFNGQYGMHLYGSANQIYNNNFVDNPTQAWVYAGATGNVFNLDPPVGGNYWSDWQPPLHADADGDGFVDSPYVFEDGQDNFPLADNDSDGISDNVEDGAPNGGDGNDDGILDSEQENVASLPNAADGRYATLASPDGTQLVDVIAIGNPSPGDAPPDVAFPVGFFEFTVQVTEPGESTEVTLILPPGQKLETYYKYGPTPGNPTDHWYEFLLDGATGAQITGRTVTLHLVDGERGDDDLTANAEIVEPGAPGLVPCTWAGFVPPLGPDNKRLFKRGSTIPVKFRISDPEGSPVTDAYATLAVYYKDAGAADGLPEVVSTAAGDWGDQFRYDPKDDLYIFNLSTKHPSFYDYYTYKIVVTLDDGQEHEVGFSLK